jgi:segregation and condensation protein A
LIKKEEIDIYDIPIYSITKQYLEYIELMKELDLEIAGEFILMAATLIRIKVQMLLPKTDTGEELEEEDPRAELVRQLIEYKRYKEVAESIAEREADQRRLFPRSYFEWTKRFEKEEIPGDVFLKDVTMFDLMTAFKSALDNMPQITTHQVSTIGVTIDEQIEFMLELISRKERIAFTEIMGQLRERVVVIVTFMAILELIRTRRIRVQQASVFSEIWISRK